MCPAWRTASRNAFSSVLRQAHVLAARRGARRSEATLSHTAFGVGQGAIVPREHEDELHRAVSVHWRGEFVRQSGGGVARRSVTGGLTIQVAERLRSAMARRRLLPGERLPPEPELAEELEVSRGTLREAMRGAGRGGLPAAAARARGRTSPTGPLMRNNLERNFGVTRLIETFGLEAGTLERTLATRAGRRGDLRGAGHRAGRSGAGAAACAHGGGDEPVVYSIDHWSAALLDGRSAGRCRLDLPVALATTGWRCTTASPSCAPTAADAELAARLRTARGALLMEIWQVDYTENDAAAVRVARVPPGGRVRDLRLPPRPRRLGSSERREPWPPPRCQAGQCALRRSP